MDMNNQSVCPQCGNVEPAGNAFCSKCGAPFAQQNPAPVYQAPPAPQPGPYNQQPYYPAAPMDNKKLFFIISLSAFGFYLLCSLIAMICGLGDSYNAKYIFEFFSHIGLAGGLGMMLLYIKEKFDDKK